MKLLFLSIFLFSNLIFSNQLEFSNEEVDAGQTVLIDLNLDNPTDVIGGFQFQITDFPNQGSFINAESTERTSGFQVQFNEQPDGSVIVVGFDLSLQGIQPGNGSILSLSYQSTNIYSSEVVISMDQSVSLLSDLVGLPIEYSLGDGSVIINGEDPPPIISVDNLTATGGFGTVTLFWNDSNVVEIDGYNIFRDGSYVGTATSTTYTDQGLQQDTEYCYEVTAFNANNESDMSEIQCATTTEIDLEAPLNLTAVENGLEIFLDWDVPPSGIGIGDPCVDAYGYPGFLDCYGVCFQEGLVSWIGDGFCDGLDVQWGVNFSCPEWECDGCDCAGTGNNSEACVEQCGSFQNNNNEHNLESKDFAEGLINIGFRDLLGYEIYRDSQLIEYTENTEYLDVSDELWYLEESCYNVVSVWDEGTSGFSNTACATPQLNGPSSLSAQGTGSFITLEWSPYSDNDQTYFNIYRDDQLLNTSTDPVYEDYETEIGQEYCYYIKSFYEGIGESPATNVSCTSCNVYPPSQIGAVAGDGFVGLSLLVVKNMHCNMMMVF